MWTTSSLAKVGAPWAVGWPYAYPCVAMDIAYCIHITDVRRPQVLTVVRACLFFFFFFF